MLAQGCRCTATTLGQATHDMNSTLKGFAARGTLSGLISFLIISIPELSLPSNSGLKLANAFGVLSQTQRWSNQNACASAGCGRRSRTFIFGVKVRGVTGYTIPHCWLTRRGSNAHLTA